MRLFVRPVDGNVRRKRCNIKHLEPTEKLIAIQDKASTEQGTCEQ